LKQNQITRIAAMMLAVLMLLSLCACSGFGKLLSNDTSKLEKVLLDHVYLSTQPDISLEETEEIIRMITQENDIYFMTNYYHESRDAEGNYLWDSGTRLYRYDEAADSSSLLMEFPSENTYSDTSSEWVGYSNVCLAKDGSIWYTKNVSFDDWSDPDNYVYESSTFLIHADASGTILAEKDIKEIVDMEYPYLNNLITCADGGLVAICEQELIKINAQCEPEFTISLKTDGWISNLIQTGDGTICCNISTYDEATYESTMTLYEIDMDSRTMVELNALPDVTYYSIIGGPGSKIILYGGMSTYYYDIRSGQLEEQINWSNSDINFSRIGNLSALADGRMIITEYSRNYDSSHITLLSPISEDAAVEKYVIDLAAINLDSNILDAVIQFNKTNAEYRIRCTDYSQYVTAEDPDGAVTQFNSDIISGKIPDLIMLAGLPYENYVSKGLLADLSAIMEEDETFDETLYQQNILHATAVNGKTYSVFPSFYIYTVAGKTANVGTEMGWTMEDLNALMQKFPEADAFADLTRSQVLSYCSTMSMDSYVDMENATCNFNGPAFVSMLEFINRFPEEIDWDSYYEDMTDQDWQDLENRYREDRTLLMRSYFSSFDAVKNLYYNFGEDFTLVGFPCPEGIGSSICTTGEIAISSKTKLTAACWDFVKYLLSDTYQDEFVDNFPVMIKYIDQQAEKAMSEPENGNELYPETSVSTDIAISDPYDVYNRPITQAQVDQVKALLGAVETVERDHSDLLKIIEEEAAAFFSGQKTAQAVADIIQSRASNYVSENS